MADNALDLRLEKIRDDGRLDEAIVMLRKELKNSSQKLKYQNLLVHCLIQNGNLKDAKVTLEELKKHDQANAASTVWNEVRLLLASDRCKEAISLAFEGTNSHPNDVEGMIVTGACLRSDDRLDESLVWLNKALDRDPKNVDGLINKGLTELARQNIQQAAVDLVAAYNLKPGLRKIWSLVIKLQMKTGNYLVAAENLSQIIFLDADFENAFELFEVCTSKCSNLTTIKQSLANTAGTESAAPVSHLLTGITYKNEGDFQNALIALKEAVLSDPLNYRAHNYLGLTYQALNNTDEALQSFRTSIATNSEYAVAHFNMAISFAASGNSGSAISCYKTVLSLDPHNFAAYINWGALLKEQGKDQDALVIFKKAAALSPQNPDAHYNIGLMLYQSRDYSSAIVSLKKDKRLKSQTTLMKCYYKAEKEFEFYQQVDHLISKGANNAVIGSYLFRAKQRFGVTRSNPFCNNPLGYVYTSDLKTICDFEEIFVSSANEMLSSNKVEKRHQPLVLNGEQTAGNVFDQFQENTKEIKNIIFTEVEKYKLKFTNSDEGFIKAWPKEYTIKGWLVSMKSGGSISPHIHDKGWISGSIYINVPFKNEKDSGNLILSTGEKGKATHNELETKNIDVVTGSICLFPSSLLHYTVPFQATENRTVLAFDIEPA